MNKRTICITLLSCIACFLFGLLLGNQWIPENRKESNRNSEVMTEKDSLTVAYTENKILPTTEYILQRKSLNDGSVSRTVLNLPESFVGMNRGEFLNAIKEAIAEKENTIGCSVLSFSSERVVVEETEFNPDEEQRFYLEVYEDKLVVLYGDKKTVYLETDIRIEDLPAEVDICSLDGYSISSEQELFDLLEAFSS